MPSISAVVLNEQNQLLCMYRADTHEWDLPGGYLELGEQPALATAREVFEETGLIVRPERLLGVFGDLIASYPNGAKVEIVMTLFLCKIVGGELKPSDGEALELKFFELDNLPSSPLFDRLPISYKSLIEARYASFMWEESWLKKFT